MTTTTPEEAGFSQEYAGIRLIEFEDGLYTHAAYGHHEPPQMAAALRAKDTEFVHVAAKATGDDTGWWDKIPADPIDEPDVEHIWAVLKHSDGAADDDGWFYTWEGVTEDRPGAFPMTIVPD